MYQDLLASSDPFLAAVRLVHAILAALLLFLRSLRRLASIVLGDLHPFPDAHQ